MTNGLFLHLHRQGLILRSSRGTFSDLGPILLSIRKGDLDLLIHEHTELYANSNRDVREKKETRKKGGKGTYIAQPFSIVSNPQEIPVFNSPLVKIR